MEGVTISEFQVAKAKEIGNDKNLKGTVNIRQGDYHHIDEIYGSNQFDRVLFLESFGHSDNKELLIQNAFKVLKHGGMLYIKDLFVREHPNAEDGKKIGDQAVQYRHAGEGG